MPRTAWFVTRSASSRDTSRFPRAMKFKSPAESKYEYDYYKQLAVIPAEQAFRPLSESECPLVKKG